MVPEENCHPLNGYKRKDFLQIKTLWENLCKYCYLTRLASYAVLEQAIQDGLAKQCFAYAEGYSEGRYIGLRIGETTNIDKNGFLVRLSAAQKQLQEDAEARRNGTSGMKCPEQPGQAGSSSVSMTGTETNPATDPTQAPATPKGSNNTPKPAPEPQSTHFFLSAPLDNTRVNKEIQTILEEIILPLTSESGVTLSMSLEVEADTATGFSKDTIRAVSENCVSLKLKFGFD